MTITEKKKYILHIVKTNSCRKFPTTSSFLDFTTKKVL